MARHAIVGNRLTVTLTDEQLSRLRHAVEQSGFTLSEQVGAMIDLDHEEWQDAVEGRQMGEPRSTRWVRFMATEMS